MADNTPENTRDNAADFIALAGDITIAWLQNANVNPGAQDVPAFLKSLHSAIVELGTDAPAEPEPVAHEPAVSVRSSVKPDHLVSLIDGKKYKTLKRHLAGHGLTPDDYRARYGLKADYPMVAESYAAQRRDIAQKLGLGRKPAAAVADTAGPVATIEPLVEVLAAPPAKPKRAASKAKSAAVSEPAVSPEVAAPIADAITAEVAPEKVKRTERKTKAEVPVETETSPVAAAVTVAKKPASAKPRRMARLSQAGGETAPDLTTTTAEVEAPAKPQRASAEPKAAAEPAAKPVTKTAAKPKAAKTAAEVSVKKSRAKPAIAQDVAPPPSEG